MMCITNSIRNHHVLKMQLESIQISIWLVKQRDTCGCSTSTPSKSTKKMLIKYKPYVMPSYTDHDTKNMNMRRPMSPHVFHYAPTLPATTSILQRITGIILTSYALLLAGGTLFLTNGIETYVSVIQNLDMSKPTIFLVKMMLGAPFAFHYFNGIRFCAWNAGRLLAIKDVITSAHKAMIAAGVVIILFALL